MSIDLGHTEFFTIIGAVGLGLFTAYYTYYFRMKNVFVRGITDFNRIIEGRRAREAAAKLYKKYFEKKEVDESDLHKAAEEIRKDLIIIQGLFESNMLKKKQIYEIFAGDFVKTIDSYQKYLEEFEPDGYGLDIPIQRLYNTSMKWVKENKLIKSVKN